VYLPRGACSHIQYAGFCCICLTARASSLQRATARDQRVDERVSERAARCRDRQAVSRMRGRHTMSLETLSSTGVLEQRVAGTLPAYPLSPLQHLTASPPLTRASPTASLSSFLFNNNLTASPPLTRTSSTTAFLPCDTFLGGIALHFA
jgi:hypothetical protein